MEIKAKLQNCKVGKAVLCWCDLTVSLVISTCFYLPCSNCYPGKLPCWKSQVSGMITWYHLVRTHLQKATLILDVHGPWAYSWPLRRQPKEERVLMQPPSFAFLDHWCCWMTVAWFKSWECCTGNCGSKDAAAAAAGFLWFHYRSQVTVLLGH